MQECHDEYEDKCHTKYNQECHDELKDKCLPEHKLRYARHKDKCHTKEEDC